MTMEPDSPSSNLNIDPTTPPTWRDRAITYYGRNERFFAPLFFVLGMIYDIITIGRIDGWFNLIQQAVYLLVITVFLAAEVMERYRDTLRPEWLNAPLFKPLNSILNKSSIVWRYREEVVHFFFGSLLSSFAIFYFLSSSFISSLSFFALIAFLLVANEFPRFRRLGTMIRFALLAICIASYFCYVVPIWWGSIGTLQFLVAIGITGLLIFMLTRILHSKIQDWAYLRREVTYPASAVLATLLLLYFLKAIPPVPLSLKEVGIYHQVERTNGGYTLVHERPEWKFWENGDQTFKARPGDIIYCFFRLYTPTGFSDEVKVRWLYRDSRGNWSSSDAVPVAIAGGRMQGYRGFAFKRNYQPGSWQVRIETGDKREIGRIYLEVVRDESTEARTFRRDPSL